MGLCCCLSFERDDSDVRVLNPDPEERRRQMAEAAEKRLKDNENRGIKDPEGYKRRQKKREQMENLESRPQEPSTLRWQVN